MLIFNLNFLKKFRNYFKDEPPVLYRLVIGSFLILFFSFIWLMMDSRLIHDQPAALKPIKQLLGTLVFLVTLPWLHQNMRSFHNTNCYSILISYIFIYEIIAIYSLAIFGLESHFNNAHPFFIAIRLFMFFGILYVWSIIVRYSLSLRKIISQNITLDPITAWSQFYGCILFSIASISASYMFLPKYSQNLFSPIMGGHSIGNPNNTARTLIGWHKYIGDLRIPHFFGLHCLQYFWLISFLLLAIKWSTEKKVFLLHCLFILSLLIWLLLQLLALKGISPLNTNETINLVIYLLISIYIYPLIHLSFIRLNK